MKKFRIVAILLVMCLASSCFVGSTFAKYSSSAWAEDTATIAKWTVKVNETNIATHSEELTIDLFKTAEIMDTLTQNETNDENVKDGTNNVAIIAPGTKGSFVIKIVNDSDVKANYNFALAETLANNDNLSSPIVYKVNGETIDIDDYIVTNVALDYSETDTYTIEWEWAFDGTHTDYGTKSAANPITITVKADVSITQVD